MSLSKIRKEVFRAGLSLALAGFLGLLLTLALAMISQPSLVKFERTLELREAGSISVRELINRGPSVYSVEAVLFNVGREPVVVRYKGSESVLGPGESTRITFTDLNEEVEVRGSKELNVIVKVEVATVKGGSFVLILLSVLLFFLSAVLVSAGVALLLRLAINQ